MPTVKQGLEQKLQQKLSPLQIQTIKLIEMPVQARSVQVYELPCTATLMDKVSLLDLLAMASKRSLEGMTVDVKLRISLKGGKGTTLTFNGLDLSQFSN